MGGSLLNGKRISKKEYQEMTHYLCHKLMELFDYDLNSHKLIKSVSEKEDFGDIDILVNFKYKDRLYSYLKDNEYIYKPTDNGVSFLFNETQIDCIFIDWNLIENYKIFYYYNDLGNMIGRLSKYFNCKLKPAGLYYSVYNENKDKKLDDILITQNIKDIFRMLDLDYNRYQQGFDTYNDMFEFVINSKYFDLDYYVSSEYNNSEALRRDKVRKVYLMFLEYCKNRKPKEIKIEKRKDKNTLISFLDVFYPECNLQNKIDNILFKYNRSQIIKKYINGKIISEITGFQNKELGDFIQYVKSQKDYLEICEILYHYDCMADFEKANNLTKQYIENLMLKKFESDLISKQTNIPYEFNKVIYEDILNLL